MPAGRLTETVVRVWFWRGQSRSVCSLGGLSSVSAPSKTHLGFPVTRGTYSTSRATGRPGSELHSDHDPGNSAASTPTAASAATVIDAVTPEPQ